VLFEPEEVVASERLRFRALTLGSLDAMSAWLASALVPEWTLEDLESAAGSSTGVLISDAEDAPAGLALLEVDSPSEGDASISFLAMDPARRFRGLGGEAGLALERHGRERLGLRRFYAGVPEGRGLAVYFWLRLGYRPLAASEAPEALIGLTATGVPGIWMVREQA
jgi:RimJ/RimL family protein N-acetyltransferase